MEGNETGVVLITLNGPMSAAMVVLKGFGFRDKCESAN
jgi:hypothetical protein